MSHKEQLASSTLAIVKRFINYVHNHVYSDFDLVSTHSTVSCFFDLSPSLCMSKIHESTQLLGEPSKATFEDCCKVIDKAGWLDFDPRTKVTDDAQKEALLKFIKAVAKLCEAYHKAAE
jgi:hypothetical protein